MMNVKINVYRRIDFFYTITHKGADWILSRDDAERYIRHLAWHGLSDEELSRVWAVIQNMVSFVRTMNLDSLYGLTIYDYQETVRGAIGEKVGFTADKASVR